MRTRSLKKIALLKQNYIWTTCSHCGKEKKKPCSEYYRVLKQHFCSSSCKSKHMETTLSKEQLKIWDLFLKGRTKTTAKIAAQTGKSDSTIRETMYKFIRLNLIYLEKKGRERIWCLVEDPNDPK